MKTLEEILKEIETLNNLEKYQEIIETIEGLSVEQLNNQIIGELARAYNNNGNYNKAIEILKTIETEEKNTLLWNYRIAYSYYCLDDYENAEKYFLKANEIDPEDEEIKNYLLNIYVHLSKNILEGGNQEEAIEYALKAKNYVSNDDNKVHVYSYLAWMYDKIEAYDIAEDLLKSILNCQTDQRNEVWAYSELGYCLGEQHRYQESLEALIKASEMGRDDIWLNTQIGWTLRILENYEEALPYLFKAKELGRDDEWINAELGICYKETDKFEEALQFYLAANEKNSQSSIWLLSEIAWLYGVLDKFDDELKYLDMAKKLGRKDEWINAEYGKVHTRIGKYEEALNYFKKAKKLGQDDAWLNAEIGQCLGRLEKLDEGIERLKRALELLEEDKSNNTAEKIFINSEIGWLIGKKEKSNPEEALHYLNIAKELGRDDIWINSEIAWELAYNDKKSEESIKYFEKAIKLGRKDEWIWSRIANVYFDLKRIEDAFQAYSKAYKLAKNSWYICNIGRCLRKLGKYEEAIKKLLQSRKLSLKEGDVVDLEDLELAYCYAALGDKKKAEKHMKLSMDSLGTRAVNEEHLKKQFDEIKEMISILSKPS